MKTVMIAGRDKCATCKWCQIEGLGNYRCYSDHAPYEICSKHGGICWKPGQYSPRCPETLRILEPDEVAIKKETLKELERLAEKAIGGK